MGLGRPHSLNDEAIELPKIRRDQHRKLHELVRKNAHAPLIALGLVRDLVKGHEDFKGLILDNEENPTCIKLFLKNEKSKMTIEYQFTFENPRLIETPTLD